MEPPNFDIAIPEPYVETSPRRVRVRVDARWIADSSSPLLYIRYGAAGLPTYAFAEDEVDAAAIAALPAGAAWQLGPDDPPELAGRWTFAWRDDRIEWFEEAERVFCHARDPQHRVDAVESDRHIVVALDGETLADSTRPYALFETRLPTRWYFRREDVRMEALTPSERRSRCPYKGVSSYFSHPARADVAWTYEDPIPQLPQIAGLIAFFNEHVDLTIDGEVQKRPSTPWSVDASA